MWPEKSKSDWFLVTCHWFVDCHSASAYTSSFLPFEWHNVAVTHCWCLMELLSVHFKYDRTLLFFLSFFLFFFMFCWPCISIHLCNKNQLDALFILGLFHQSASTCFGHICSIPILANRRSTKKHNTYSCCIYTVYLLMMAYRYAHNM